MLSGQGEAEGRGALGSQQQAQGGICSKGPDKMPGPLALTSDKVGPAAPFGILI